MKRFDLQMIDWSVSQTWWIDLIKYFICLGDSFEIVCWKDELEEISIGKKLGSLVSNKYGKNDRCNLSSAHYGTEIYIDIYRKEDVLFFTNLMDGYKDYFSLGEV